MSQFRASIRTQVYSSQMFRQEVLHRLRKTSPPRSPPGSFQAAGSISAFPACSTDFLWEPRSPLSKKAQRVEGIPTHSLAGGPLPFYTTQAGSDCRGTYWRFRAGALGRLRSGVSPRPLGSQGALRHSLWGHRVPEDIYHTSAVCQNRKCPLASSAPTPA